MADKSKKADNLEQIEEKSFIDLIIRDCDKNCHNFFNTHVDTSHKIVKKLKQIKAEKTALEIENKTNQALREGDAKMLSEKDELLRSLETKMKQKSEEIMDIEKFLNNTTEKHIAIEISYNEIVRDLKKKMDFLSQKADELQKEQKELAAEYEVKKLEAQQEIESKEKEKTELRENIQKLEDELKSWKEKFFECQKEKIAAQVETDEYKALYEKKIEEMATMEDSKNKTIEELKYKVHSIDNVINEQVIVVKPNTSTNFAKQSDSNAKKLGEDAEEREVIAANASTSRAPPVPIQKSNPQNKRKSTKGFSKYDEDSDYMPPQKTFRQNRIAQISPHSSTDGSRRSDIFRVYDTDEDEDTRFNRLKCI